MLAAFKERNIKSILVCGVESHVCVMQTCLDFKAEGMKVGLLVDAIGSRSPIDWDTCIARMQQHGIEPMTVESAIFELMQDAKSPAFKPISELIK